MSFWASSYRFPLDRFSAAWWFWFVVRSGPVRVSTTTIVRKPARCFPGLVISRLNLFDAMLGRVTGYERLTEARTVA